MKTVAHYPDPILAHLAKGRLEAEGIESHIAHEHHVWANWLYSTALGGVKIQVADEVAEKAREILAQHDAGAYALDVEVERFPCPACGSADTVESRARWRLAFVALFFFDIPIPFRSAMRRCTVCGHKWNPRDDAK